MFARLPHVRACGAQAKKVRGLQAAFQTFNSIMRRPGRGDLTFMELQVCHTLCQIDSLWCPACHHAHSRACHVFAQNNSD